MPRSLLLLIAVLFLGLPARSRAQAAPEPQTAAAQSAEDALRPGDVIRLRVWREPDLSGEFSVDEQGEVVLPRIGRINVTGESPDSLKERLVRSFSRYLTHSSIDVDLLRRIQVLGAVRNPGLYPVDGTMRISEALALAGGATPDGDPDRVELVRDGKKIEGRLTLNTQLARTTVRSGDQLIVPERGWLNRYSGIVAAGLTASASLVIALLTR